MYNPTAIFFFQKQSMTYNNLHSEARYDSSLFNNLQLNKFVLIVCKKTVTATKVFLNSTINPFNIYGQPNP